MTSLSAADIAKALAMCDRNKQALNETKEEISIEDIAREYKVDQIYPDPTEFGSKIRILHGWLRDDEHNKLIPARPDGVRWTWKRGTNLDFVRALVWLKYHSGQKRVKIPEATKRATGPPRGKNREEAIRQGVLKPSRKRRRRNKAGSSSSSDSSSSSNDTPNRSSKVPRKSDTTSGQASSSRQASFGNQTGRSSSSGNTRPGGLQAKGLRSGMLSRGPGGMAGGLVSGAVSARSATPNRSQEELEKERRKRREEHDYHEKKLRYIRDRERQLEKVRRDDYMDAQTTTATFYNARPAEEIKSDAVQGCPLQITWKAPPLQKGGECSLAALKEKINPHIFEKIEPGLDQILDQTVVGHKLRGNPVVKRQADTKKVRYQIVDDLFGQGHQPNPKETRLLGKGQYGLVYKAWRLNPDVSQQDLDSGLVIGHNNVSRVDATRVSPNLKWTQVALKIGRRFDAEGRKPPNQDRRKHQAENIKSKNDEEIIKLEKFQELVKTEEAQFARQTVEEHAQKINAEHGTSNQGKLPSRPLTKDDFILEISRRIHEDPRRPDCHFCQTMIEYFEMDYHMCQVFPLCDGDLQQAQKKYSQLLRRQVTKSGKSISIFDANKYGGNHIGGGVRGKSLAQGNSMNGGLRTNGVSRSGTDSPTRSVAAGSEASKNQSQSAFPKSDLKEDAELVFCTTKKLEDDTKGAPVMQGFPVHIGARYLRQLLAGLRFLKSRNILHTDLKPDNIMFMPNFGGSSRRTQDSRREISTPLVNQIWNSAVKEYFQEQNKGRTLSHNDKIQQQRQMERLLRRLNHHVAIKPHPVLPKGFDNEVLEKIQKRVRKEYPGLHDLEDTTEIDELFWNSELKIADFGEFMDGNTDTVKVPKYRHNYSPLAFRAPELSIGDWPLTPAIDMFSFACVAWQLMTGLWKRDDGKEELNLFEIRRDIPKTSTRDLLQRREWMFQFHKILGPISKKVVNRAVKCYEKEFPNPKYNPNVSLHPGSIANMKHFDPSPMRKESNGGSLARDFYSLSGLHDHVGTGEYYPFKDFDQTGAQKVVASETAFERQYDILLKRDKQLCLPVELLAPVWEKVQQQAPSSSGAAAGSGNVANSSPVSSSESREDIFTALTKPSRAMKFLRKSKQGRNKQIAGMLGYTQEKLNRLNIKFEKFFKEYEEGESDSSDDSEGDENVDEDSEVKLLGNSKIKDDNNPTGSGTTDQRASMVSSGGRGSPSDGVINLDTPDNLDVNFAPVAADVDMRDATLDSGIDSSRIDPNSSPDSVGEDSANSLLNDRKSPNKDSANNVIQSVTSLQSVPENETLGIGENGGSISSLTTPSVVDENLLPANIKAQQLSQLIALRDLLRARISVEFIDLLFKCMDFDKETRLTPGEALDHDFFHTSASIRQDPQFPYDIKAAPILNQ